MRAMWQKVEGDENVMVLHLDSEIPDLWKAEDIQPGETPTSINAFFSGKKLQPREVLRTLHEALGVVAIRQHNRYGIQIAKGQVFDWDEIQPRVIAILCEVMSEDPNSIRYLDPPTEIKRCEECA